METKVCCIIDADGFFKDCVSVVYNIDEDGYKTEEILYYSLAEDESLVDITDECRKPVIKKYSNSKGFIKPKWDKTLWIEGATEKEILDWEKEHPALIINQSPNPLADVESLVIDHEYRLALLELNI